MSDYRYILEKGSRKFQCPECRKKAFVRYIDTETGDYLPDQYGRCDREINCGYHVGPREYFRNENLTKPDIQSFKRVEARNLKKPDTESKFSCIPQDVFRRSRAAYEANNLIQYLLTIFDPETVSDLIARYHIGTSRHWPGSAVFWQIDEQGRIRTGKIMQYSPSTGKRVKEPFNHIAWVHKALKTPDFTLKQCLFGSHLLKGETKPVAIVESEKTAIIASVYLPEFIWLATGGLSNLNAEQFKALEGHRVVLFPDLGAFGKWSERVKNIPGVTVSDFLEKNAPAPDHGKGLDLADYLVRIPVKDFDTVITHEDEFSESITRGANEYSYTIKKGVEPDGKKTQQIVEPWMPEGWYYQQWTRQDGVEIKTLVNGIKGFPANWDEPEGPKEATALLIHKNRGMLSMIERINLFPESFTMDSAVIRPNVKQT